MKNKKKSWLIVILVVVLLIILFVIAGAVIKELKDNEVESKRMTSQKNNSYDKLEQKLTCTGVEPIIDSAGNKAGNKITTYYFSFTGDNFNSYRKEILLAFDTKEGYQNYCLNCDSTEASDIKDLTKGIQIDINTSVNKYILEVVDVDLEQYDGPFKESKYGLDGLTKKSNIDDALYLTRNMVCYWK